MARIQLSGTQIPTLSKLNIDGELTLDAAAGTSGQVLTSAGAGVTPTWTTPASGSLGYIGNYQTTSASVTSGTVTIGGATGANIDPFKLSLLGGNTTSPSTTGGGITIRGGNSTNTGTVTTGGSILIIGGNGNSTQGAGGIVEIYGGTGSAANGNGAVYIGSNSGTDTVSIGNGSTEISLSGAITLGSSTTLTLPPSLVLNTTGAPGVLTTGVDLQFNIATSTSYNAQGALGYEAENYYGIQTSSGKGAIPIVHSVISLANSSSSTNTTQSVFAAANDVLSSLQAAKLYRFRAKYFSSFTYAGAAGAINVNFAFSNAPTVTKYTFTTYPQAVGTATTSRGVSSTNAATTIVPSQSSSGTWVTEFEGYFITHATLASTFTPQFINTATNSSTAVMQTGSWLEIQKVGTSTQTLIAGNWA